MIFIKRICWLIIGFCYCCFIVGCVETDVPLIESGDRAPLQSVTYTCKSDELNKFVLDFVKKEGILHGHAYSRIDKKSGKATDVKFKRLASNLYLFEEKQTDKWIYYFFDEKKMSYYSLDLKNNKQKLATLAQKFGLPVEFYDQYIKIPARNKEKTVLKYLSAIDRSMLSISHSCEPVSPEDDPEVKRLIKNIEDAIGSDGSAKRQSGGDDCKKYYSGYLGNIEYAQDETVPLWGGTSRNHYYGNFIVIGVGNGNVTIKGVLGPNWRNGGNYPGIDKVDSMSCSRLRAIEK